mmetsp:Transcript_33227/g.61191  ORF Transcript_33227/g.61191 Transcript_33227/m.61191 type:complete len:349 (-) Transcript_33227:170-1216(-)
MSDSKSASALRSVLRTHRSRDVAPTRDAAGATDKKVVELNSNDETIEAAKTLWEHNILGAPVWDESKGKYVGFFDMRDILSAVISVMTEAGAEEGGGGGEKGALFSKYNERMVRELSALGGDEAKNAKCEEGKDIPHVSYLAARNPFVHVGPDSTLEEMCRALAERKCHRVPILNGDGGGKCQGIVSQSALVKFLSKNVDKDDLQETLDEAGLPYRKDVVSVLEDASATDAFRLLDSHRLSGIAVIDEEGKLVGNTSARDIKLAALDEGRTSLKDTDILSYLARVRQSTASKKERYPSCHVHAKDSTVGHVVHLLAKTGYHRVFVVDEDIKPVGVISVADILKFAIGS